MDKSKAAIEAANKWTGLRAYIELIEANREVQPRVALDGAKSLLESVAKTVLADRGIEYGTDDSLGKLVKHALRSLPSFVLLETQDADTLVRLVSGLESISVSIGTLRNRHGAVGHGQDLHDGRQLNLRLAHLALDSVDALSAYLMEVHISEPEGVVRLRYEDQPDFNTRFDEEEGEIEVGGVVISPSRALFDQDIEAYKQALIDSNQKESLISALEASETFATTHRLISRLGQHSGFSERQVRRLVEIGCTNSQVAWIMGDTDVRAFYTHLLEEHRDVVMAAPEATTICRLLGLEDATEVTDGTPVIDATPEMEDNN